MLLSGGSTTKAASKTIPVQEERAKVLSAEIKKTDTDLFFHVLRPNKGLSNPECPPTTFAKTRGVWPVVQQRVQQRVREARDQHKAVQHQRGPALPKQKEGDLPTESAELREQLDVCSECGKLHSVC